MINSTVIPIKPPVQSGLPVKYAKLARPDVYDIIPRPRLFRLIDTLSQSHSVIWLKSPPGAGKTILAASYITESNRPVLWYQIDECDSDSATLFYFLDAALRSLVSDVPRSTQKHQDDIPRFGRLFFRNFYSSLPDGTIVVFDNVHEFDWKNSGALMACAFMEIPPGITVLALSRDSVPSRLTKMELCGKFATIDWHEMRLDSAEATALAGFGSDVSLDEKGWLKVVDGWAAGIVMLRNFKRSASQPFLQHFDGRDALFRYFSSEIFERMPAQLQRLLMQLSYLPGASPNDVQQLTGDSEAVALLHEFYENNLFVECRRTDNYCYHFHPLFQEFLQFEVNRTLELRERNAVLESAVAVLDATGRIEEAVKLLQTTDNPSHLVNLLLRHAASMMAGGRGEIWREWMSGLPLSIIDTEPELWYWQGISLIDIAPRGARKILIRAEQSFDKVGKIRFRLLAIAAILESFHAEWSDLNTLSYWIEKMQDGLPRMAIDEIDSDLDIILHSRLALALILVDPSSSLLASTVERVMHTLPLVCDPVERLAAGAILLRILASGINDTNIALVNWLVAEMNKCAEYPAIGPHHRVKWYACVARWYCKDGNFHDSQQVTCVVKDIVVNFDLDPLLFQFMEVTHLLGVGNLPASRSLLDQLRISLSPLRITELIELNSLEADWRSLSGDVIGALASMTEVLRMSAEQSLPAIERSRFERFMANCYALVGEFDTAECWFSKARKNAYGHDVLLVDEEVRFVAAYRHWRRGECEQAVVTLRETMNRHRLRQATTLFPMHPNLAQKIIEIALEGNIEAEHVRTIICRQRLSAPDRFTANWPWPVSVRTFGKFEMSINGESFVTTGKAQQRPLLLLKNLIIVGDRGKELEALAVKLWPDSDDAKSNLNVTVHRLRKMLSLDEAVVVAGGKIRLSDEFVWTDLTATSNICSEIESLRPDVSIALVQSHCRELLALYRGPFCEGEEGSWVMPIRDRWRSRFLAATDRLGQYLEVAGQWEAAISLYRGAIEAEPLAEACYRGLMRCSHAKGDFSVALCAYRRCRETLSLVAGVSPSIETLNLMRALGLGSPPSQMAVGMNQIRLNSTLLENQVT